MDAHINIKLSYQNLKKRIKKNEGFSFKPYKDHLGFITIGFGHLILSNEKKLLVKKTNLEELENIFLQDFNNALKNFKVFLKKFTSNTRDSELLIEMVFQIGIKGVLCFKKLLNNMDKKNKHLVCFEMMDSLWYKQTPNRVKALISVYLKNE